MECLKKEKGGRDKKMPIPAIAIILLAAAVLAVVVLGMTDWFEIMFLAGVVGLIFWSGAIQIKI